MRRIDTPVFRITISMIGITLALVLCAYSLRVIPDAQQDALAYRKKTVEALTVQLSSPVMLRDVEATAEVLDTVVERNAEVLSVGLRDAAGDILIESGDHERNWRKIPGGRSTAEFVRVPLYAGGQEEGSLEVRFRVLPSPWELSLSRGGITALLLFVGIGGTIGFFLVLRRALKTLDPNAVIPERVRLAMDTLVEGIIIMDEEQNILLANRAFGSMLGVDSDLLVGKKAQGINWRSSETGGAPAELPWVQALRLGLPAIDQTLELRAADDSIRSLSVNATPVLDPKGVARGVLASFSDMTELQQRNHELQRALAELESSRESVERHNAELQYLATRDPLTGCLNRRAFFEAFDAAFARARAAGERLHCAMVDIDHFKKVNDKFGHGTGDRVIAFVAETIRLTVRESDLVCRYGGEEYCVVFSGLSVDEVAANVERIRKTIIQGAAAKFTRSLNLTVSAGLATQLPQDELSGALIERADIALYAAKNNGRNRLERWREDMQRDLRADTSVRRRMPQDINGTWRGPRPGTDQTATNRVLGSSPHDAFGELVSQSLALAARHSWTAALMRVQLETSGQLTRQALSEIQSRVSAMLRRSDTLALILGSKATVGKQQALPSVAPLGLTEIGVLLPDVSDINAIGRVVQRLIKVVTEPLNVGGVEVFMSCSTGISVAPVDGEDFDTLMHCAEQAQRITRAMRHGERYAFYQPSMTDNLQQLMRIESGLRRALERGEFRLVYQPLVSLETGRVGSLEALLRWTDGDGNDVAPDRFIPVAEACGLIGPIGDWVLHMACVHARNWQSVSGMARRIAVNVSAVQVMSAGFSERVGAILRAAEVDSRLITLEITETAFISDMATAAKILRELRRLGVHIALDDFGTGYSSLSYLKQLPIDSVKIDARFIRDLNDSPEGVALVTAIVGMAHGLGIRVVAEGVESTEISRLLKRIGCDEVQGYVISKPVPLQEAIALADFEFSADGVSISRTPVPVAERARSPKRALGAAAQDVGT